MANELTTTVALEYEKGGVIQRVYTSNTLTVTGTEVANHIQSIGITEEAVAVSDMATQGYVYAKNLDATNYVEIGTTGKLAVKLLAGESAVFRTGGALYAQANTAACRVHFIVVEN